MLLRTRHIVALCLYFLSWFQTRNLETGTGPSDPDE